MIKKILIAMLSAAMVIAAVPTVAMAATEINEDNENNYSHKLREQYASIYKSEFMGHSQNPVFCSCSMQYYQKLCYQH